MCCTYLCTYTVSLCQCTMYLVYVCTLCSKVYAMFLRVIHRVLCAPTYVRCAPKSVPCFFRFRHRALRVPMYVRCLYLRTYSLPPSLCHVFKGQSQCTVRTYVRTLCPQVCDTFLRVSQRKLCSQVCALFFQVQPPCTVRTYVRTLCSQVCATFLRVSHRALYVPTYVRCAPNSVSRF